MTSSVPTPATAFYRALLIGIDDYKLAHLDGMKLGPLEGCVRDVDALAAWLAGAVKQPIACSKLVAPRPSYRPRQPGENLPTLASIEHSLAALAADAKPGDRALVYYAGHGVRIVRPSYESIGEALVPIDFDYPTHHQLLWDLSFGALLDGIFKACGDLTVILDCCHAASQTRNSTDGTVRGGVLSEDQVIVAPPPCPDLWSSPSNPLGRRGRRFVYTVAAAVDPAHPALEDSHTGKRRGVFTTILLAELERIDPHRLATLRWADLFPRVTRQVQDRTGWRQSPQLVGPAENWVLGGGRGAPIGCYLIEGPTDNGFVIHAGTLCGLEVGAKAVLLSEPPVDMPPPGPIPQRLDQEIGRVVITAADEFVAFAAPCTQLQSPLPLRACALVAEAASASALRVGLAPEVPPAVRRLMISHAGEDGVVYLENVHREDLASYEAFLGADPDGSLWIGDRMYGPNPACLQNPQYPLGRFSAGDLGKPDVNWTRRFLRHYGVYVRPLRLAHRARERRDEQWLELAVFHCTSETMPQYQADWKLIQYIERDEWGRIPIQVGDQVAFLIRNYSKWTLHCALLDCSSDGMVERLGFDQDGCVEPSGARVVSQGASPFKVEGHGQIAFAASPFEIARLVLFATPDPALLSQVETMECADLFPCADTPGTNRGGGASPPDSLWLCCDLTLHVKMK